MFYIRRATVDDMSTLLKLARMVHFINLPADKDIINEKVIHSRNCFIKAAHLRNGDAPAPEPIARSNGAPAGMSGLNMVTSRSDLFMFVLEDTETGSCLGTAQIVARMGGPGNPNLSFRIHDRAFFSQTLQQGMTHKVATLYLDETGPSEIGGLIMQPSFRRHKLKLGRFLSLVRFHFMGLHREMFSDRIIAEMMAPITADGHNLLWDYLGRRFINLSYTEADRFCQYSREFMTSLLPREDIYLTLLPPEARAVVGQVGPETVPARRMLENLGFRYTGYIDPFDGGPHLEARTDDLSIVRQTRWTHLGEPVPAARCKRQGFVSVLDSDGEFRSIQDPFAIGSHGQVQLSRESLKLLKSEPGAEVGVTLLDEPAPMPAKTRGAAGRRTTGLSSLDRERLRQEPEVTLACRPHLAGPPADLIGAHWAQLSGDGVVSRNPARPGQVVWSGSPMVEHVDKAVGAARAALPEWSTWPREKRFAALRQFQKLCASRVDAIAELISLETGKVMWDAKAEAQILSGKVDITLDDAPDAPLRRVSDWSVSLGATRQGRTWFRPHGVMAVVGPYNFPAHLPNGHIVPALAMGNTVVLKPSDKTPGVGQLLIELLREALDCEGAPAGVVNLVQGGADVASRLVSHAGIDGILFTGSWPVGRRILEANLDRPGRIIALEMGGNNPAVILPDANQEQAVIECVRSAFVTTGQRCTCTRRVIVHESVADRVIGAICKAASNLIVGQPDAKHPVFMGPMISKGARDAILAAQASLDRAGGTVLLEASIPEHPRPDSGEQGWYITPGVVRVDSFSCVDGDQNGPDAIGRLRDAGCDAEFFGPLLRVSVARDLDDAIGQANATRFGLAASIFTKDEEAVARFLAEARAGCINVNTGTAGASSKLPFGGLGLSGNHRPAGAFSLDYCAYPVAGMIESGDAATMPQGMRFEESWVR